MTSRNAIPLWWVLLVALGFVLGGCPANDDDDDDEGADTDGDGLSDADEATLGTDPTLADTDGDGLDDGEEVDLGTDPVSMDTDGDTFIDPLEINENFDPLDGEDIPYIGGYGGRDICVEDSAPAAYSPGDTVSDFTLNDQHGQAVTLSDFCGRAVFIEAGANW